MIASDLDGTLLNSHHKISERNKSILRKLSKAGLHIVLISGRMTPNVVTIEDLLELDLHLISYNGAACFGPKRDGRPELFRFPVSKSATNMIIDFVERNDLVLNVYHQHKLHARCKKLDDYLLTMRYVELAGSQYTYVTSYQQFRDCEPHKLLILTNGNVQDLYDMICQSLPEVQKLVHLIRGDFFVELLDPHADKGIALQQLCQHLGIPLSEVIAFGDGENDKDFLAAAGLGIAMNNANALTKTAAKKVSQWTNDEDGVSRELEQLLLHSPHSFPTSKVLSKL